jgi:ectoine hydroxylase-related dioxygenase (phytanoyl-CoA dioxygenase family)
MTDEQRIAYEAQGYLVVEGVLDADTLRRVRAGFDRAAVEDGLDALPNWDELFIHFAEHPVLFPVIHAILGDDVQVRSLQGLPCPPGAAGRGWHREVAGLQGVDHPHSTLSVQAVLHLEDVPADGACLAVVPGSHRFAPDLPFPNITRIEEMPHHVVLRVKAGTAVVVNGNLWQARTRNRSGEPQRLLEYTYIHCWMRQALPELSPRALEVASSTHNLRQLFGIRTGARDARWYWNRRVEGYPPSTGLPERRFSAVKAAGRGERRPPAGGGGMGGNN